MRTFAILFLMAALFQLVSPCMAADPVVTNVTASQVVSTRTVRITYDLTASSPCTVSVLVSDNDGRMFTIIPDALSGAVGDGISSGVSNEIIWNTAVDIPNVSGSDYKVRVIASTGGLGVPPNGHTMVSIPAGAFNMGHPGGSGDQVPVHSVTTSVYQIDKYEVTCQQYANFLNNALAQGMCTVVASIVKGNPDAKEWYDAGSGRVKYNSTGNPKFWIENGTNNPTVDFEQHPMVLVTWYGTAAYCNWLSLLAGLQPCFIDSLTRCDFTRNGYRLPTEAEWEKAARGGQNGWNYPWGDAIDGTRANYTGSGDSYENYGTTPVGFYSACGYGLNDMSGNVWEWINDWYDAAWYSNAGATSNNATGPLTGTTRVLRGGSWLCVPNYLRCAYRGNLTPANRVGDIGFRCARGSF